MLETLKKLVGMDEASVEARRKAAEEEQREREARVAQQKDALKEVPKADRQGR